MEKQVLITVYNDEDFYNVLAEIKSALDYDNIEYDYKILEETIQKFTTVKAIVIDTDNFDNIISDITKGTVATDYDDFTNNMLLLQGNEMADMDEINKLLSEYFNVEVTGCQLIRSGEGEPVVYVYYAN